MPLTPVRASVGLCALVCLLGLSEASFAQDGRNTKDIKLFETYLGMLEEDPYQPYALRRLLEVSHVQGGLSGLIVRFEAQTKAKPGERKSWVVLGHLYRAGDRKDEALAAYKRASEGDEEDWRPHRARALVFKAASDWQGALSAFDDALERAKKRDDLVGLWQEAADTALEAKALTRAQAYFSSMRARAPKDTFLHMEAAAALARRGFTREALGAWREVGDTLGKALKHQVVIWRQIATLHEELGELDDAEATWRAGLQRLGRDHWARPGFMEGLVSVYRRRDKLAELAEELEGARAHDRNLMLTLAHLHEELGRDLEAKEWLERALKKRRDDVATRLRLISILERIGPPEALLAQHEALVKLSPGEPGHALKLAALYFQREAPKKGFRLIDRLRRRYGSDPGVHQRIIDLTMRYGGEAEHARIEKSYRALLRLEPSDESHLINFGEYWWSKGERDKALQVWRGLNKLGHSRAQGQLLYAEVLLDHGLVKQARSAFEAALRSAPDNPRILRSFARFLEGEKRKGEALELWKRVLEVERGGQRSSEARRRVVKLWQERGALKLEEGRLRARFEGESPEVEAGLYLVEVLLMRRESDGAERVLERLRELAPERLEILSALERLYTRKDRVSDAIEVLETLARLNPREAYDYLHRAADLALGRGDLEGALETTRRVVALNPAAPSAHERVGDLYRRMGKMADAVSAWRQVLLLDPRNDAVRFKLADLYRSLESPERERQELLHIVRETSHPSDALKAGRRLLEVSIASGGLREVEEALRPLALRRADRSDVYLKLLIDVFVAEARALRWTDEDKSASSQALSALGERALKPLLEALDGNDVALRARALEVILSTRSAGAVPALTRTLLAEGKVARVSVAAALGAIGSPSAVKTLMRLYEQSSGHGQRVAIWALGLSPAPEALAALSTIAKARQPQHRILSAWALGARAQSDALPTLVALAKSADQRQRIAALWALGQSPSPTITQSCAQALRSKDPLERQLASQALSRVGTLASQRLLVSELWGVEGRPEGHLALALMRPNTPISNEARQSAYMGLVDLTRERLSEDRSPLISSSALSPSTRAEGVTAIKALTPLLKQHIERLLKEGSRARVNALLDASTSSEGDLQLRPILASDELSPGARAAIQALWSSSHEALWGLASGGGGSEAQAKALILLSQLRDVELHPTREAAIALEALHSPWPKVQAAALHLLARAGEVDDGASALKRVEEIVAWYPGRESDALVRRATAGAIGRLRAGTTEEALEVLEALLDDSHTEVRLAAVGAARQIDSMALLGALGDRVSDRVAEVAREALGALKSSRHAHAKSLLNALSRTHRANPSLRWSSGD